MLAQRTALSMLIFAVIGCTYLRETIGLGPQRPRVVVSDVQVTKASMNALDLLIGVKVDNPNGFALNFKQLQYTMTVDNKLIASGAYAEKLSVPAEGRSQVKLPVTIDPGIALQLAQQMLLQNLDTEAVIHATAVFETPFGDMDVAFDDRRPLKKVVGF